jgi:amino acid transporter
MLNSIRRFLLGAPLASERMIHERLGKIHALPVLSSDALSSVAYATEEILLVLVLAGAGALSLSWPIALGIAALLLIVGLSYYQTIHAYPTGGGAYVVARENLGTLSSHVAGAALLMDYVLTVAVSVSAGVAAITSAAPALLPSKIWIAIAAVAFITIMNLRGVRESGSFFAVPTYFFVATIFTLLIVGVVKTLSGAAVPAEAGVVSAPAMQGLTLFLILRAFTSGCTALTGIEAISDGVPVFKAPESDNAGKTLIIMIAILVTMFLGITFLVNQYGLRPVEGETVVSQLARSVFGKNILYFAVQIGTALILFLAANTSYADFPRLSRWMAEDRYLPHQLANLGDRLVYSNGIMVLGVMAALLIVIFRASTHSLIPLYAVGVFISFTLSQVGMVRRWFQIRTRGWQILAALQTIGALATGIVAIVMAITKFTHGAWVVLLLIPLLMSCFRAIRKHYDEVAEQLSLSGRWPVKVGRHTIVVPVSTLHRGVIKAVRYAQVLCGNLHAVTIEVDSESTSRLAERWAEVFPDVPLEVIPSPYRSVITPLVDFVNGFIVNDEDYVTIVLPEFVPTKWWHQLLHNQTALMLKLTLTYGRKDTRGRHRIVTDVPFYLVK